MRETGDEQMTSYTDPAPAIPQEQLEAIAVKVAQAVVAGLPRGNDEETKLDPATKVTQSIFSEIRFGLGSRNVDGTPTKQQLSSRVIVGAGPTYTITYQESDLPYGVDHYDLVYAGGKTVVDEDIVVANKIATITVPSGTNDPSPFTLLAVKLKKSTGPDAEVVLVSFVTQPVVQAR
jgi:hypothetical protein